MLNDYIFYIEKGEYLHAHKGMIGQFLTTKEQFSSSYTEFINSSKKKILLFDISIIKSNEEKIKIKNQILDALAKNIFVIVTSSEINDWQYEIFEQIDYQNVLIFVNASLIDHKFKNASYNFIFGYSYNFLNFYKNDRPDLLDKLTPPYPPKPLLADILLGSQKQHRDLIFNFVKNNTFYNNVIMSYRNIENFSYIFNEDDFQPCEPNWCVYEKDNVLFLHSSNQFFTMDFNRNYYLQMAEIIPTNIYNQSNYSIIAETNPSSTVFSFFSEKTFKPILCKRLFIAVTNRYYLRSLRELGFKTFDGIIDESYDLIEDDQLRWTTAMKQLEWLYEQDTVDIINKIHVILEYNFHHLMMLIDKQINLLESKLDYFIDNFQFIG